MKKLVLSGLVAFFASSTVLAHDHHHDHHHHDHDDHHHPIAYTSEHYRQAEQKGVAIFKQLAIPGSEFVRYKTWENSGYIWVKIIYSVLTDDNQSKEEALFLACHPHGSKLGCHRKKVAPTEPRDKSEL